MNQLSEKEANKLFNEVSKAVQEDDTNKVSDLLATETPDDELEVEEIPDPDLPADEEDEPEDEGVKDEQEDAPEDNEPADEPAGKDEDDPLKDLRDQLAAMQKENQALRSQAGRVPHVQRKLDELDKKLAQLTASPSSQASAKITPKVDELLKDIEETDPALAKAMKEVVATAIDGLDEEHRSREIQNLQALREQEAKAYQQAEVNRLLEMYPDAPKVFASPQWAEWKKEQPEHILRLAQSDNADYVALAFDLYARDMRAKYPELAEQAQNAEKATKVEEVRRAKQQKAANLDRPNVPAKDKQPTNPEALFAKFSEEIRKDLYG